MKVICLILFSAFCCACSAQKAPASQTGFCGIKLRFENRAGDSPLLFDSTYHTLAGEDFKITPFKYYISHISFTNDKGRLTSFPDQYFLVDQRQPETFEVSLTAPAGAYMSLGFLIGVDSIRNVSGAQTGALDPVQDMFWTWNSGYVMAKLEGTSTFSNLPNNRIEYHVGGFKAPYNTAQMITLPFDAQQVGSGKTLSIVVGADVLAWFDGAEPFSIKIKPSCTTPGAAALALARNYAKMFSIKKIQVL